MKRETVFLRLAVFVLAVPIVAACLFLLPYIWREAVESGSWIEDSIRPIVIGMYVSAIPFFLALFQAFMLLRLIDRDEGFSYRAVQSLRMIKYCALAITAVYIGTLPFFYWFAERDDAPGFLLIGLVFVFAAFVVAVFAELLQKLLKRAIDMKQENDLTV
ncbi:MULTISPECIES: DUF2975 domain-containing protein [unclassified Exiguobacterium]|uniref:DUF2975 domain-containing protein n=1 Tax=unclassified Exiguobacterium TaxID=2644629 RepID=UPI0005131690|nr:MULTISPECIES: DUF2975 domain-containing protein [unclassified Exiguobacterium]KGI86720.1 membrane protein [Exiguobacterium mexicanum]